MRKLRVSVRLPLSPSTELMNFDDPCVVTATSRRTLRRPGRRRFAPSGSVHATPLTHTRSIQPLSIAGCPDHQVGYTSTSVSHHWRSSAYEAIDGSVPGSRWSARSSALNAGSKSSEYRSVRRTSAPPAVSAATTRLRSSATNDSDDGWQYTTSARVITDPPSSVRPRPGTRGVRRTSTCRSRTARATRCEPAVRNSSAVPG